MITVITITVIIIIIILFILFLKRLKMISIFTYQFPIIRYNEKRELYIRGSYNGESLQECL